MCALGSNRVRCLLGVLAIGWALGILSGEPRCCCSRGLAYAPVRRHLRVMNTALLFAARCCTMLHMDKTVSPPKKPPRVSVPLSAETLQVFQRLAKAGNMSTGRAIAEWLDDTIEAADLMASTMERARAAPKIVTAELHAMMLGMADQTKELADKYSRFKGSLDATTSDAVGGKRRATAAAEGGGESIPPSCNTGGKVPKNTHKKHKGGS